VNTSQRVNKEKYMKTSYLTIVLTLTFLLGLGANAYAQDASRVLVTVPFEFVAGGKTLPAGAYSVGRLSPGIHPTLLIHGKDNGAFALVLPSTPDGESAGHAELNFERVGDQYYLTKVETPAGVYPILTLRAMAKLAQMNDHNTTSSSGTN
jgi:hypothetical protein